MREVLAILVLLTVCGPGLLRGQPVEIDSFHSNGQLTWSAPSGSVCAVEWTPSLVQSADWQQSWVYLKNIVMTNAQETALVPMFYRVTAFTNGLLVPMPVQREWQYLMTNAVGAIWTQSWKVAGTTTIPEMTNAFAFVCSGPDDPWTIHFRSTETQVFMLTHDESSFSERLFWQAGPVGTQWSWPEDEEGYTNTFTIVTNETITALAGIFDCIKIERVDSSPSLIAEYWVAPGIGLVQLSQYDVDPPCEAPEVMLLKSVTDK